MVVTRIIVTAGIAAAFFLSSSCEYRPVYLNKSEYPTLPSSKRTEQRRARGERDPVYEERMFWGNYGGPGDLGGQPVDEMDRLFYEHDLAYTQGVRMQELLEADRELVRQLTALDPATLSPEADAYRKRAILFFKLPVSRWIGKPGDVLLRTKRGPAVIWTDEN